jgi:hypothetical protein
MVMGRRFGKENTVLGFVEEIRTRYFCFWLCGGDSEKVFLFLDMWRRFGKGTSVLG